MMDQMARTIPITTELMLPQRSTKTWSGPLCTTAQHQRHSTSATAWNRAASSLPHSSGFCSLWWSSQARFRNSNRTRSDGKLFNISRLKAKTRVREVCLRDFLFADDAAVTIYTEEELQQLMQRFTVACEDFGLAIKPWKYPGDGTGRGCATFYQHPRVCTRSRPQVHNNNNNK